MSQKEFYLVFVSRNGSFKGVASGTGARLSFIHSSIYAASGTNSCKHAAD